MDSQYDQKSSTFLIAKKTRRGSCRDISEVGGRVVKGRWTQAEHQKFIQACLRHGCDWKKVGYLVLNLRFIQKSGRETSLRSGHMPRSTRSSCVRNTTSRLKAKEKIDSLRGTLISRI
jgi:hypothetical protein